MKETTLVIMAAGMGSRYGGVKQLDPVGPSGEIIMDYSVYDAISAGFNKVVFIIRKELEKDFREVIGDKFSKDIEVDYVFQELDDLPDGFDLPKGRTKPWGTGQAVLSCKGVVNEPFAVINADDYYGKEAFIKIHDYLASLDSSADKYAFCMAGFVLGNTLSDNGTVTRGVCKVDEEGILIDINETADLIQVGDLVEGRDLMTDEEVSLDINSVVSMNMWGFTPELLEELDARFKNFLKDYGSQLKTEYLLPDVIADLIKEDKADVRILSTKDKWFGVTYKEDKEKVMESFQELIDKGLYPNQLF